MNGGDLSYLAGLLDGEGCIEARASGPGQWIRPMIEVCMTNPLPLRWACATFGIGSIYACPPDIRGKRRRAWKWVITDTQHAARPGHRRAYPEAECKLVHLIATLKSNGGEPNTAAYQEALDLCIYLKQLLMEQEEEANL